MENSGAGFGRPLGKPASRSADGDVRATAGREASATT
jgi:hypothetical protein